MDRPKLIGDIVTHWHKYGERRKTVAFAVNVAHSIHLRDEFVKSGVRAEHIDGTTPKPERDATLARLASGEIELVTNCMVLTEGWDMPEVGCCILARPTQKMGLYRQMIGRVLRPAEGKPDAIVLDHCGAVFRHGFVEDHVEWTLDPDRARESAGPSSTLRMAMHRACSNARNAAPSASPASHVALRIPAAAAAALRPVRRRRSRSASMANGAPRPTCTIPRPRARWHAMLACNRQRARLQAGLGRRQLQGKIRRLAAYGAHPRRSPNTRSPIVGALAPDRLRQAQGAA